MGLKKEKFAMSNSELETSNKSLQLPNTVNNINVAATANQKLSASGSATGNLRNKCALKPGHSLMDWIRLGNTGVDLSGTCGRVLPVSSEELAQHNKVNDAWMAIRGKVYNVTRYMDFHPGGVDELMRGVGRDATKLFDEIHAWVNYPQLLNKCYIGPLKYVIKVDNDMRKVLLTKSANDLGKPTLLLIKNTDIVPRFDWIQKRNEITFYIYTRQFANPGVILQKRGVKNYSLRMQIAHNWHEYDLQLEQPVQWPAKNVQIGFETGKIEIIFTKMEPELWTTYGIHETNRISDNNKNYDFKVLSVKTINHDSYELNVSSAQDDTLFVVPIGYHVNIETALKNGEVVQRCYTPVNGKFLADDQMNDGQLNFLIKSYKNGQLSRHLKQLQAGAVLQVSVPHNNFSLYQMAAHRNLLLLAAGSGITPFLNLIEPLLKRQTNRLEKLRLIYFNKTAEDIWANKTLNAIAQQDERFTYLNVLSQMETTTIHFGTSIGSITKELLATFLDKSNKLDAISYIAICGPNTFNAAAMNILKELDFKLDNVYVFQS